MGDTIADSLGEIKPAQLQKIQSTEDYPEKKKASIEINIKYTCNSSVEEIVSNEINFSQIREHQLYLEINNMLGSNNG